MKTFLTALMAISFGLSAMAQYRANDVTTNNNAVLHSMIGSYNYTNIVVVDAGHGSDSKPAKFGYASIGSAQTNAHAGDTVLVRSGSYAGSITNGAVNWYLENGSTVNLGVVLPAGINIFGYGTILGGSFSGFTTLGNAHIECFKYDGNINSAGFFYYIKADIITNLYVFSSGADIIEIHGDSVSISGIDASGGGTINFKVFAGTMIFQDTGGATGYGCGPGTLFSSVTLTNQNGGDVDFDNGSPVVWAVGYSKLNGNTFNFPASSRFVGSPMFDHAVTGLTAKGSMQIVP